MPFVIIKTNTEHSLVYAKSFFFLHDMKNFELKVRVFRLYNCLKNAFYSEILTWHI